MTESLMPILEEYVNDARSDLQARWSAWTLDLSKNEMHEVIGGLLARQVSLATELARNPDIWNPHIGPLVLRSMVDLNITLSWILLDPEERAKQFIAYGLGQVKLLVEHLKAATTEPDTLTQQTIDMLEDWHNVQRLTFLTDVNVGSWSGTSTRKMAEEAGCLDLYKYAYTPLSEAAHSMWHHISVFNLEKCTNPLHRLHAVPHAPDSVPQLYFLEMAAKYLEGTLMLFDEKVGLQPSQASAFSLLMERLHSLNKRMSEDMSTEGGEPVRTPSE